MINDSVMELYRKFRLINYKDMFCRIREKEGSLSATEAFSADIINLLHLPTVSQFAEYIGISQPNATYKINSLVNKGYVEKVQGVNDKRECYLGISDKFRGYFHEDPKGLKDALDKVEKQFSESELKIAENVLKKLLEEL